MSGKRISLELPEELVEQLDRLRKDWKTRSRGECLRRLLEEIFQPEAENDGSAASSIEGNDASGSVRDGVTTNVTTTPARHAPPSERPRAV